VDAGSYAVVKTEGQFAASMSILVGTPNISEEFVEVKGFWLPGHVRSVTASLMLGPTELDIQFSNYQLGQDARRGGDASELSRQPEMGYIAPQAGGLQEPNGDADDYHHIQNRLDAGSHGDVPIDQVQRHSDQNQHNNKIEQRHFRLFLAWHRAICCPLPIICTN
jgi:hypothetical protein